MPTAAPPSLTEGIGNQEPEVNRLLQLHSFLSVVCFSIGRTEESESQVQRMLSATPSILGMCNFEQKSQRPGKISVLQQAP